uniref:Uncharacterized protein n=1 Tax=Arundo donax TaxID=35708 RepID=A0A0A8XN51_ARUDO
MAGTYRLATCLPAMAAPARTPPTAPATAADHGRLAARKSAPVPSPAATLLIQSSRSRAATMALSISAYISPMTPSLLPMRRPELPQALRTRLARILAVSPGSAPAEAERGAPHRAQQVPDARVEGKVLAPRAALHRGLLLEQELRRGGEVVECLVGDVEVLVRVVQPAAGGGGVGAVVGSRWEQPRVGHVGGAG